MPHFKGAAPLSVMQLSINNQRAADTASDVHVAHGLCAATRDGVLDSGESFTFTFQIAVDELGPFDFSIDILGSTVR